MDRIEAAGQGERPRAYKPVHKCFARRAGAAVGEPVSDALSRDGDNEDAMIDSAIERTALAAVGQKAVATRLR